MKNLRQAGAYCVGLFSVGLMSVANAVVLPLEARLAGLAYYDPNLDITWAANANINGKMTWEDANTWAASLSIDGVTGWRLPSMNVNGDSTFVFCETSGETACLDNEYGYLYYQHGVTASTPGPFNNLQSGEILNGDYELYWSGSLSTYSAGSVFTYDFNHGDPYDSSFGFAPFYAMAVYDGDVSAVPVPAAMWLFGSGLLGLIGITRRKKTA